MCHHTHETSLPTSPHLLARQQIRQARSSPPPQGLMHDDQIDTNSSCLGVGTLACRRCTANTSQLLYELHLVPVCTRKTHGVEWGAAAYLAQQYWTRHRLRSRQLQHQIDTAKRHPFPQAVGFAALCTTKRSRHDVHTMLQDRPRDLPSTRKPADGVCDLSHKPSTVVQSHRAQCLRRT